MQAQVEAEAEVGGVEPEAPVPVLTKTNNNGDTAPGQQLALANRGPEPRRARGVARTRVP